MSARIDRQGDDLAITIAVDEDWDTLGAMLSGAFLEDMDEEAGAAERLAWEPDRTLLAKRGDELLGSASAYTRRLAVPGGTVPAAHVTGVAVSTTARRQGVLTRLMHRQLADILTLGEPIAVLWASEGRIYQRWGYGLAARRLSLAADAREVSITAPAAVGGRLRVVSPADARDTLIKLYDEEYAIRPGWSERAERHWSFRLSDPSSRRGGASKMQAVLREGPSGVDGYALWRTTSTWDENGPAGEVRVLEHVATNREAYADLWRFLLGMDLTRTTRWFTAALDEPIQYMVNEPRRLGGGMGDTLWVRVVDVPAALAARRYAAPVDVVLEVTDDLLPQNAGRWRLTGSGDGASCVAATDPADLALDIRPLGAAYLGDASLATLAGAGQVREITPGALATASTAFGWYRAPSATEVF